MRSGRKQNVCNVEVDGQKVEQVEVMNYLSAMSSSDLGLGLGTWIAKWSKE